MWSSLLKVLGGTLLTLALVWGLVLAWWQSNEYEPSKLDLLLYLGAIPLALIGGFWLLRGFIEHLKAPSPAVPTPVQTMLDDDPLSGVRARTAAAERGFSLCLVDAWVNSPAGNSVDDVLAALDAGQSPQPSAELVDDAGFPAFVAEVKDVDVDGMAERLLADQALRQLPDQPGLVRALTLLDGILAPACGQIASLCEQGRDKPGLHTVCLIPAEWGPCMAALRSWLGYYWREFDVSRIEVTLLPVASEVDALKQVDETILRANREGCDNDLFLLVAASSSVDEQIIESWAAHQRLFTAQYQERSIPGEGAAALLLASRQLVERLDLPDAAVVSRTSHGHRDKRVNAGGRISGRLIEQLITGLLDVSAVDSTQIKIAVADADHRSGQITEMLEGLGELFSHLDPIKDCLALGRVNGALGPVGSLIALACTRARVLAEQAPGLCISNQHEIDRAALIVTPFVSPASIEPHSI